MEAWFETKLLNNKMELQEYLKIADKSPGILYCVVVQDNSIRLGIYITYCGKNLDVFNIMIQLKNKSKIYTFHRITKFKKVEKTIPYLYTMEINLINLKTGNIEVSSEGKLIHIEKRYLMEDIKYYGRIL